MDEREQIQWEAIKQNLDSMGVPGQGVNWTRILEYAETFHLSTDVLLEDTTNDIQSVIKMSEDQEKAWNKIEKWAQNDEPYFILRGAAGSGKSYLTAKLKELNKKIYFTAPTNKAAKVLGNFVGKAAKTTFSQLGLRMSADDETLIMDYKANGVYMSKNAILVVDEVSMVGHQLFDFIDQARKENGFKVFLVGDPAQLPPVSEKSSPVWRLPIDKKAKASLKKIMRFDNQLLNLSTRIREQMQEKNYKYPIVDDNDKNEGVFVLDDYEDFEKQLLLNSPADYVNNKVVAWRNKTVNSYNKIIRKHLGFKDPYCLEEIVLIAQPVEENDRIIANIDDEFVISSVVETSLKAGQDGPYIPIYKLGLTADVSVSVNIPMEDEPLKNVLNNLAAEAKRKQGRDRTMAWRKFWEVRKSFHSLRYAYSITSHRIQGSTLNSCFVDVQDILANKNRREAFRSLYVAATRPTKCLYTF